MVLTVKGKALWPYPGQILREIMASAQVDTCEVTSVGRTPETQARIMYENLIGTGDGQGIDAQLKLYMPPGQAVIQVYVANKDRPRDEIVAAMQMEILRQGPEKVSHHCSMTRWVFDVGPSSIAVDKQHDFLAAALGHPKVIKVLSPWTEPKDPAIHIEIPKEPALNSSRPT